VLLFTVIALIFVNLWRSWEADFEFIYSELAHFADLKDPLPELLLSELSATSTAFKNCWNL